jgi:hypothetical protein
VTAHQRLARVRRHLLQPARRIGVVQGQRRAVLEGAQGGGQLQLGAAVGDEMDLPGPVPVPGPRQAGMRRQDLIERGGLVVGEPDAVDVVEAPRAQHAERAVAPAPVPRGGALQPHDPVVGVGQLQDRQQVGDVLPRGQGDEEPLGHMLASRRNDSFITWTTLSCRLACFLRFH